MTRSSSRAVSRAAAPTARAPATLTRGLLVRLGLYWGTLFVLGVGSCTLTFWILASATGVFSLGAPELYLIRAVGLTALALGAAGIFFIVGALRRVTLPIREIMESAERIAGGDYSTRVREQGPRELRALARSFNRMAEKINENEAERRTLVGNIAGELRSPLSMLKENIDGLLDGNFARDDAHLNLILGETIRLSHLVDEMRMLALAESGGLILQREVVELNALVGETVKRYHRDASRRQVALHAIVPDAPLSADVDPGRIQEVLGNLLNNALRSPLKSDIRVELTPLATPSNEPPVEAQIEVAYRGEIIAPQELSSYFDRFYRRDAAREDANAGSLELAIAKLLVQAHDGAIAVTSDHRSGTRIKFTLPLAEQG